MRKNPSSKNLLIVDSNLFHLHGYNFYVVGSGIINFDSAKDPEKFSLIDPPKRNTVGVSTGGLLEVIACIYTNVNTCPMQSIMLINGNYNYL